MKIFMVLFAVVVLFGPALVPGFYGMYLAFKASFLLGVLVLIIEPSPTILGWVAIFGHPEACEKIAAWLHLPL